MGCCAGSYVGLGGSPVYEVVELVGTGLFGYFDLMLLARLPRKPFPVFNSDCAVVCNWPCAEGGVAN